ncbi:MAG: tyrosine protein kinase [Tannerella sp.]|jgi:uncharacterized protein involved in exopolysaccharide biosynthesis|nr:tyrosine protein kinase [Tannerella sp.]
MENKDNETIGLKGIIAHYLHHWKLFLGVFVFSIIPAVLYLNFYPRTFGFMARVQVQEDTGISSAGFGLGEAAGIMKSFGIGGGNIGTVNIEDEISILTSTKLLSQMILELGLNTEYSKPWSLYRMYNEAPLKLTVDSATMLSLDDEYTFKVSVKNRKINVKARSRLGKKKAKFTFDSLPAQIRFAGNEFTLDFDNNGSPETPIKLNIACMPASWKAEKVESNFLIEELSKSSNVIELSCTDHVRERGKEMLNVLIQKYNDDANAFKHIINRQTLAFVDNRMKGIIEDLQRVEAEIEQYKTKNQMTLLEADVTFYTEQMKELQLTIITTETQARLIHMMDSYVKDPANKYNVIPPLLQAAEGEGSAITLYNEAILERDRLLQNSNENNPAFKSMNAQVDKLRDGVYTMIENAENACNETLEDLKSKEQLLLGKMKSVPAQEREYMDYKRQQEILQGIYLVLLQKQEEVIITLGDMKDHARVIDPAFTLKKPVGPRMLFAGIGMILLTLLIPVGYLFAKDVVKGVIAEYKRSE